MNNHLVEYSIKRSQLRFAAEQLIKDHKKMCITLGSLEFLLGFILYFISGHVVQTPYVHSRMMDMIVPSSIVLSVIGFSAAFGFGMWMFADIFLFEKNTKNALRSLFE